MGVVLEKTRAKDGWEMGRLQTHKLMIICKRYKNCIHKARDGKEEHQ